MLLVPSLVLDGHMRVTQRSRHIVADSLVGGDTIASEASEATETLHERLITLRD